MPTSGVHITVVEQCALANGGALIGVLGDPAADPNTDDGRRMSYAKLGAIGPDIFYFLGDFNSMPADALQDLVNFMVKLGGTFSCVRDLSEEVNRWIIGGLDELTHGVASALQKTSALVHGALVNGFLAILVEAGFNALAAFRNPRQEGYHDDHWFWGDYLHYVYTGDFVRNLLGAADERGNPNLIAFSRGYLTHYVTDVVGHPFVNQIVGGPFRMHWQRHHLVENFIDAHVWPRWHTLRPQPDPTKERPLDRPNQVPNPNILKGAPILTARLHDHINVGVSGVGDPVDAVLQAVCSKIRSGLFDIGAVETTAVQPPNNADFTAWCQMMVDALRATYAEVRHPRVFSNRPDGFPLPEDVAGAYGVLRLFLRIGTDENLAAPVFPDIAGDITDVLNEVLDKIKDDIGGIPPIPIPNTSGAFSLPGLIDALAASATWLGEVLLGLGKVLLHAIEGLLDLTATLAADAIKVLLWLLNSALFALFRTTRDVLVLNGYSSPYTDQLGAKLGDLDPKSLFTTQIDDRSAYPAEEDPRARKRFLSKFRPFRSPFSVNPGKLELPTITISGPYPRDALPGAFIEGALGHDDMFSTAGPQTPTTVTLPNGKVVKAFTDQPRDFGGAIANSVKAISQIVAGTPLVLPNYDLDADRGMAWPQWSVPSETTPFVGVDPNAGLDPDPGNTGNFVNLIVVNAVPRTA